MSESDTASTQEDLEATRALQPDASGLERVENLPDPFNVFETVGLVRWETVHSRFLAFLLDPKQSHGLGNAFLAGFLRKVSESTDRVSVPQTNDDDESLDRTTVHTEVYTDDGRIDILLLNEVGGWAMIVENKIDTTEHHDQLDRYYRFVKKNYPGKIHGVYLTPHGVVPTRGEDREKYKPLSYGTVCDITDRTLEELGSALSPDVLMSMEHYTQMVKKHIVGGAEKGAKRTLAELHAIAADQGNGKAFATILDAARRHGLQSRAHPWSVMYTSPANRGRSLFTVGVYDRPGRGLLLEVAPEAWTDFYDVPRERVETVFGGQQKIVDVTPRLAEEFAAKLDRLFDDAVPRFPSP